MNLTGKTVRIIGTRRLHNEILAEFIRCRLGAECLLAPSIHGDPLPGTLLLLDCLGADRESLLCRLRQGPLSGSSGALFALFNLGRNSGIENKMLAVGARGIFYEDDSAETLLKGISILFSGEFWVPRRIMSDYLLSRTAPSPQLLPTETPQLTRREREVLALLANGASNDQIGSRMCISTRTVKTHVYNIFRKIHVSSRLEAALWIARHV
ncbi:MAG: response regulator transcription factor [Trichloromonas sp.]|jgi:LuxR family transcriptional regulator of csgAB operon|nr:response regulator transcription factor [Trichloromonas sp.]